MKSRRLTVGGIMMLVLACASILMVFRTVADGNSVDNQLNFLFLVKFLVSALPMVMILALAARKIRRRFRKGETPGAFLVGFTLTGCVACIGVLITISMADMRTLYPLLVQFFTGRFYVVIAMLRSRVPHWVVPGIMLGYALLAGTLLIAQLAIAALGGCLSAAMVRIRRNMKKYDDPRISAVHEAAR